MQTSKSNIFYIYRLFAVVFSGLIVAAFDLYAGNSFFTSYPQVYELGAEKTINLFNSSIFRQKNIAFFNELLDSTKRIQKEFSDSLRGDIVLKIFMLRDGRVDSVTLADSTMTFNPAISVVFSSINSWKFRSFIPTGTSGLLIIQKFSFKNKPQNGVSRKNILLIIIGITAGFLLLGAYR